MIENANRFPVPSVSLTVRKDIASENLSRNLLSFFKIRPTAIETLDRDYFCDHI